MSRDSLDERVFFSLAKAELIQKKLEDLEKKEKEDSEALSKLNKEYQTLNQAILLSKKCIEEALGQKSFIEKVISEGLTAVLGAKFVFIFEPVYGDDNVLKGLRPRLKEDEGDFDDPLQSFGASALGIITLLFKIGLLLLCKETAKVVIFDEPLANVNGSLQERFKDVIESICNTTGLQLVMTTHLDQPFGTVYSVTKEKDIKTGRKYSIVRKLDE